LVKRFEIHTRKGRVLTIEAETCEAEVIRSSTTGELGHQRVVLFNGDDNMVASFYDADYRELADGQAGVSA
jgi:hypothetical protein